jgi:hypothetical protein
MYGDISPTTRISFRPSIEGFDQHRRCMCSEPFETVSRIDKVTPDEDVGPATAQGMVSGLGSSSSPI